MKIFGVFCALFSLLGVQALNYTRTVEAVPAKLDFSRPRAMEKCLFLAERQAYVPYWNHLHYYLDRPLFSDIALRTATDPQKAGFLRDLAIGQQYGLDGFGSIAYYGLHVAHLKYLQQEQISHHTQMMVLCSGVVNTPGFQAAKDMLIHAGKSPYTTRYRGKIVCWNYGNTANLRQLVKQLRADKKVPEFIVFGLLPFGEVYQAYHQYEKQGKKIPAAILESFRRKLQADLDLFGAVQMRLVEKKYDPYGFCGYQLIEDPVYTKYLLPLTREVMNQKQNRDKLLGAYIHHGYINHMAGWTENQHGTAGLRAYMEAIIKLNPDVLMFFEWNEANENTSFQPTVSSGRSLERLLNYYKSLLNRQAFTPRPGDDLQVPNLILSSRQALRLGEAMHLELMRIPDGTPELCRAQIKLYNTANKLIAQLPLEKFPADKMTVINYQIPSEQLAGEAIVRLELQTQFRGKTQKWHSFDPIRIEATTNNNYLYTRHALREILPVKAVNFRVQPRPDGTFRLQGKLAATEKLASLEVVESGVPVTASGEWDRQKYELFRGTLTSIGALSSSRGLPGYVEVSGSQNWRLAPGNVPWECFRSGVRQGKSYVNNVFFTFSRAIFLLAIPKAELAPAAIRVHYGELCDFKVKLAPLLKQGIWSQVSPRQVRLELEKLSVLGDYPALLKRSEADLDVVLPSGSRIPVYQLRGIAQSGKIYRSPAIVPTYKANAPRQNLTVYSETLRRPVPVKVIPNQVPRLQYRFDNTWGDWLVNFYEPRFNAALGGGWLYAYPMSMSVQPLPENFKHSAPTWSRLPSGELALKFDGHGNYLTFSNETIPNSAAFTLDFDFMAESAANQVLLRSCSAGRDSAGLQVIVEDGFLKIIYAISGYGEWKTWDTLLQIKPGKWQHFQLKKDFSKIKVTLDQDSEEFIGGARAMVCKPLIFGSYLNAEREIPRGLQPFKGWLRSFSVVHDVK